METKFIFVTGGVYSSLGKGVTASSIGRILKQLGFSVTMQKLDPYLNVDPSFISPLQHGEVFITKDGAKADLDLGNYERFVDHNLNKYSTVTSGRIYQEVINNERNNKYDGKTVQIIPHITNQIISKIRMLQETNKTDFAIVEIGGTVGDIESLPFIHAICDFTYQYGKQNVMFAHCVPLISVASVYGELKTKPAQHSVKRLRSLGVSPDLLLLRSSEEITTETREKISWSCSIKNSHIFECMDLKSTYFLPEELYKQGIQNIILEYFNLSPKKDNFKEWLEYTNSIKVKKDITLNIAIVGEYVDLHDAYISARASLDITAYKLGVDLNISWIQINNLSPNNYADTFKNINGVLLTPIDNTNAKIATANLVSWLSKQDIPTLAYGNALESIIMSQTNLSSDQILIPQTENVSGEYNTVITDPFIISYLGTNILAERHHHECEINPNIIDKLPSSLAVIGTRDDKLDMIKFLNHNFFYGVYSNPEFTSKPLKPDPLYWLWLSKTKEHYGV